MAKGGWKDEKKFILGCASYGRDDHISALSTKTNHSKLERRDIKLIGLSHVLHILQGCPSLCKFCVCVFFILTYQEYSDKIIV